MFFTIAESEVVAAVACETLYFYLTTIQKLQRSYSLVTASQNIYVLQSLVADLTWLGLSSDGNFCRQKAIRWTTLNFSASLAKEMIANIKVKRAAANSAYQ